VKHLRIAAYIISGLFAALAGIGLSAYAGSGDPLIGGTYTLAAIAAAVLGGVSFLGGQGYMRGTIAGVLLTDLIMGRTNPWTGLYDPSRKKLGSRNW
jgi:ribose transport system permease protein